MSASDSVYGASLLSASDEDLDGFAQSLPPELNTYLRTRLVGYLCEEDRFSAEIQQRERGQQPFLVCSLARHPSGMRSFFSI